MSLWNLFQNILPDIQKGSQSRKTVRSKHKKNLQRLRRDGIVNLDFKEENVSQLGEFAENKHHETIELARSIGYCRESQEYKIHSENDQIKIKEMTNKVIWRIRIKNLISKLFIFLVAIVFLLLSLFVTGTFSLSTFSISI